MDTVEFCEIRRRHPEIAKVVDGTVLVRELRFAGMVEREPIGYAIRAMHESLEECLKYDTQQIPLSECLLICFEGTAAAFLYHSRTGFVVRLSTTQRQIFELLAQKPTDA
jgi:hypothetical protein